jgi:excisionase family DNA binding protein
MEPKVMRMADAAKALGISRSKVYSLASAGQIPVVRIGGSLRVPSVALDRWLEEQTVGGSKPAA